MLRFLQGYVWFKGEGGFPERLLTEAAAKGLTVTDSHRQGETLFAACPAGQYKKLRPLAKRACMRLRIYRKRGLYFRLFPYRKRMGMPVGLLLAGILLYILSGRIWVVQVESEVPVDETAILSAVEAQGVYPGCRMEDIDMRLLRLHALSDLEEMVYVSVNPSGCVARVTVNKRDPKPSIEDFHDNFSNLVAETDGRIISTEIHSGQVAVKAGDGVTAGTLLVSGTVESAAGNLYLRRSSGKVIAETTRTLTVTVPFSETQTVKTNEVVYRPYFRFLRWDIPLFGSSSLAGAYAVTAYYRQPQANDITLPIGLVDRRFTALKEVTVQHTESVAKTLAEQQLKNRLDALAAEEVKVTAELSRDTVITADAVTLTVTLRCEEDIAKEVPLKFADNSAKN